MSEPSNASEESKTKIIVALDVETGEEGRRIITDLKGEVGAFKIGLQLFTAAGASFVREVASTGVRIFLDLKFHDIPNTVSKASIEAARLGIWMFNVHALGGSEMMRKTVESVREVCDRENLEQPKIIGVTVLTSSNEETLREVGIDRKVENQVLRLARLSKKCGLDGIVASPREVPLIRGAIAGKDFLIVTPGIRNAELEPDESNVLQSAAGNWQLNETNEDQKRVMTPKEAVRAGSDYLVIGRPVLAAPDKISAVRKIREEIQGK